MIRHAGLLALAVVSLVVTMIQPSFGASLVAAVGLTALFYARLEAALGAAIALSAITVFSSALAKSYPALLVKNDPGD